MKLEEVFSPFFEKTLKISQVKWPTKESVILTREQYDRLIDSFSEILIETTPENTIAYGCWDLVNDMPSSGDLIGFAEEDGKIVSIETKKGHRFRIFEKYLDKYDVSFVNDHPIDEWKNTS